MPDEGRAAKPRCFGRTVLWCCGKGGESEQRNGREEAQEDESGDREQGMETVTSEPVFQSIGKIAAERDRMSEDRGTGKI